MGGCSRCAPHLRPGPCDRIIPPEHGLVMAANAGVTDVIDLDAGHDVVGDAPEALAQVLDRLAATQP